MGCDLRRSVIYIALSAVVPFSGVGQTRTVSVAVVNGKSDPAQPVTPARVSINYFDGSRLITTARDVTNAKGQALLQVPADVLQGVDLRLDVKEAGDLVIFSPADGQLNGLPTSLRVTMLPKGSAALLGPSQIEALLKRSLAQVNSQQKQIRAMQTQLTAAKNELSAVRGSGANDAVAAQGQQEDFSLTLQEWARASGFSAAEVDSKVKEWAAAVQAQKASATSQQKALAEIALKHYAAAASLFKAAGDAEASDLDADERAIIEARRGKLRDLLKVRQQSADAFQLAAQYHSATEALLDVTRRVAAETKRYPEDKGLRALWLQALSSQANARRREGEVAGAANRLPLLRAAGADYKLLEEEHTADGDALAVAIAQRGRADVMVAELENLSYAQSVVQLKGAVESYRQVLMIVPKETAADDWAATQVSLAKALWQTAVGVANEAGIPLLLEAVEHDKSALIVYERATRPADWARTMVQMGDDLTIAGELTSDVRDGRPYSEQALGDLRAALQMLTKQDNAQDWAQAQTRLSMVLHDLGRTTEGDTGVAYLRESVDASRHALEVYQVDTLPGPWADAQMHLAWSLAQLQERISQQEKAALLDEQIAAIQKALQVYTEADEPGEWSATETYLAFAKEDRADLLSDSEALHLYDEALAAYKASQSADDKESNPGSWAVEQYPIARVLWSEARCFIGAQREAKLDESAAAYRAAFPAFDLEKKSPNYQEDVRLNTAYVWNQLEISRGHPKLADAVFEGGIKNAEHPEYVLAIVASRFHEKMFRFEASYRLEGRRLAETPTGELRVEYMEYSLTADHFDTCLAQLQPLSTSPLKPQVAAVRDALALACRWGAGDKSGAIAAAAKFRVSSDAAKAGTWSFPGTQFYLEHSDRFAVGRDVWKALFNGLEAGDAAVMAKALDGLRFVLN